MLDIINVDIGYGDVKVIKGLSMSINQGSIVALLGANAAGKTTLISAISGTLPTKSGEIYFKKNLKTFRIYRFWSILNSENRWILRFFFQILHIISLFS